jgi:hypothetical protein
MTSAKTPLFIIKIENYYYCPLQHSNHTIQGITRKIADVSEKY